MRRDRQLGFTFMELIIVTVILGIMAAYAIGKSYSMGEGSMLAQAEGMARDIRHTQALAMAWSQSLRLTITSGANGSYSVSCVTAGSAPCNASPVVDPATGQGFTSSLSESVSLSGTASTVDFTSMGQPSAAITFTLTAPVSTTTASVAVSAVSGFVTVSSP